MHELCRDQWHYRIPTEGENRHRLWELCEQALAFQNHFLSRYRSYLLDELRCAAPQRQTLAAQRLAQIRYPDSEVVNALDQLHDTNDTDLRQAIETALDRYAPGIDSAPRGRHTASEQPLNGPAHE